MSGKKRVAVPTGPIRVRKVIECPIHFPAGHTVIFDCGQLLPSRPAKPILFSDAMVRAILDGRKTQTRRIVNPSPLWNFPPVLEPTGLWTNAACYRRSPYGAGDLLWVRETHYRFGHWESIAGPTTKSGRTKWRFVADRSEVLYEAPDSFRRGRHHKDSATPAWHKRLGRFMPRSSSRIRLQVAGVRVERLRDINEEDAKAEGTETFSMSQAELNDLLISDCSPEEKAFWKAMGPGRTTHRMEFEMLWSEIHGPKSWELNPWVWVVSFRRLQVEETFAAA